jgi:ABC-type branched-subunit amino acid transport system ATPase component
VKRRPGAGEVHVWVALLPHTLWVWMEVVMYISQRVMVLDHGQKIAERLPEAVRRDSKVIEAYSGR